MTVISRRATSDDASLLYGMIRDLARYEREENSVKVLPEELHAQMSQDAPPFECLIAEVDGKPCGFALYFFAYSTWEGTRTLYLEDLFVYPEFRGVGAGAALMRELARTARERNCKRFEWSVLDWNQTAIDFYERLGAKPVSGWTRYRVDGDGLKTLAEVSPRRFKVAV